ncbi:MAG: hypothetical protein WA901_01320, partial [Phormidesmis sp.]
FYAGVGIESQVIEISGEAALSDLALSDPELTGPVLDESSDEELWSWAAIADNEKNMKLNPS